MSGQDVINEKDITHLLNRLFLGGTVYVSLGNSQISLKACDGNSKISLSSLVYQGGNFIPHSVRKCIVGKTPFKTSHVNTNLTVDEENYQIFLNYLGLFREFNSYKLKNLLEEFTFQADEWRLFLDEHDKHDLVHIFSK